MSVTATWMEDNGTATGSPAKGATRGNAASPIEWQSNDSRSTSRADHPILAGNNSFVKYNFVHFTGTFNSISDVKFAHTAGVLGTGLKIYGAVSSQYQTPTADSLVGLSDISAVTPINSGATVLMSTTGPEGANPTAELTAAGYTQYIVHQLRTQNTAAAGDTGTATFTVQYREN